MNYLLAGGAAMSIGVISEIAQIPGSRDAQFQDLLVDAIGIFGALGTVAIWDRDIRALLKRRQFVAVAMTGLAALAFSLLPTLWLSYSLLARDSAIPVLLSFEHPWETNIYAQNNSQLQTVVPAPPDWPMDNSRVLRSVEHGKHGSVLFLYPHPDWRNHSALSFIAASGGDASYDVTVSVRDIKPARGVPSNRYFERVKVGPTPRRVNISFQDIQNSAGERAFDMQHISAVIVSATVPGFQMQLLLDDFRLE